MFGEAISPQSRDGDRQDGRLREDEEEDMKTEGPHRHPPLTAATRSIQERNRAGFLRARPQAADGRVQGNRIGGRPPVQAVQDRLILGGTSPVREGKVIQARQRIAEGYYWRPEVKEALSRAILESIG